MESVSKEETLEKLDQEITVNLQKIDSNLSFCFHKITQDIISHVAKYSEVCERIMDSTEWLGTMFQETGLVNLQANTAVPKKINSPEGKIDDHADIFPTSAGNSSGEFQDHSGPKELGSVVDVNRNTHSMFTNDNTDDFHTANITSTGQILKLPDSSDEDTALSSSGQRDFTEEDHEDAGNDQDESTIQRQSRKRKISLLLQQQYGSSSSIVPSPIVPNKMRKQLPRNHYNNIGDDGDENSNNIESSPLKQEHLLKERVDDGNEGPDEEENTKEVPKPGTIIHFSTNR
ncbi:Ask1p SKDI_11G1600 [Saccharomyces kudriavzevii IFO 1802]|uniref:DASH complex subunit ASK1 n=2 Tax=Saccharomyces kudriavzevii (strain ATCC MYA-4449 / AS 2.2408 / CBS 8840 / NBRC 1802 / NCYC 2889) TaxID=226230 RepID=J6EII4_SACK1|nr:uncharacterized protein SKDI_11G1600 [Saccharomyces kudriavzevii IFO 1802]EJT43142.1 ASK1-like protein [Saccharomyces kudriavzevii IFO 1802]CAI4044837.1 hypothetical protein SKDI_11G1600 [Saccharomyces kudriavzevii IFO 1802]